MDSLNKYARIFLGVSLLALAPTMPALADDVEIFKIDKNVNEDPDANNANILFILDTSGSMDRMPELRDGNSTDKKWEILQKAFEQVLFEPSAVAANGPDHTKLNGNLLNKKIAIMVFRKTRKQDKPNNKEIGNGGYFIFPLTKMTTAADAANAWCAIKGYDADDNILKNCTVGQTGLTADSNTPLSESLYEATLFFRNQPAFYPIDIDLENVKTSKNISGVEDANHVYNKSPLAENMAGDVCTSNSHIVMMTDGEPNEDRTADANIKSLAGEAADASCSHSYTHTYVDNGTTKTVTGSVNNCLDMLAGYLHTGEGLIANTMRNVKVHTIAFDLDKTTSGGLAAVGLLEDTAKAGGGESRNASNAAGLAAALKELSNLSEAGTSSFVAPALSVSQSNSFTHDKEIYYALFEPTGTVKWKGNLRAYQMLDGAIKDFSDTPISVFNNKGLFVEDAKDKWNSAEPPMGDVITSGGAGSNLPVPDSRIIRTNTSGSIEAFDITNITAAEMGVADDATRNAVVAWARGGSTTMRENPLGDPLHSQPAIVNYGGSTGKYIFFASNEGFVHSIDADDGVEKFAFIPKELLPNLNTFMTNASDPDVVNHPYGIDGNIVAWVNDANGDGEITTGGSDHVYLYFGLRRGGKHYYALNVTDPTSPSILWQINGGSGTDVTGLTFLSELGDTWSTPIKTKIRTGNTASPTTTDVLVFGGGYDENQDTAATAVADTLGKAVYIVNASTGTVVWKATDGATASASTTELVLPEMNYSIPSDIAVIDLDMDEVADRLYFGDMGGQVFRIDLNSTHDDSGTVTYRPYGILLASLGGSGTDQRRFYYAPDIALAKSGIRQYLSINIGSGYRASPKSTAFADRFYALRDDNPFTPLTARPADGYVSPALIKETATTTIGRPEIGLLDATADVSTVDGDFQTIINSSHQGWYIKLTTSGEKVLAPATTAANVLLFTTYIHQGGGAMCSPATGSGRLYMVNLFDGTAVRTDNTDPNNPVYYRYNDLIAGGIPPSPLVFLEANGTSNPLLSTIVGTQTFGGVVCDGNNDDPLCIQVSKTFWQQITQ